MGKDEIVAKKFVHCLKSFVNIRCVNKTIFFKHRVLFEVVIKIIFAIELATPITFVCLIFLIKKKVFYLDGLCPALCTFLLLLLLQLPFLDALVQCWCGFHMLLWGWI